MAIIAIILICLGYLAMMAGGIWGLVLAFQESAVWGLLYFFVPFAAFVFIIKKWSRKSVRRSFFLSLGGFGIGILGTLMTGLFVNSLSTEMAETGALYEEAELSIEEEPMVESEAVAQAPSLENAAENSATPIESAPEAFPSTGNSAVSVAQSETQSPCDFKQCMSVGYAAYEQKDYQTALINFERALRQQPDNEYAINAVNNTQAILQQ